MHETRTDHMAMRSHWKMWTEAGSEDKALRVFERVRHILGREALDRSVEPYPKIKGFVVVFQVELENEAWNDCVVGLIGLGQRVGYGWVLTGDILVDPGGWSNEPRVSGARSIQWMILPKESVVTTPEDASP